MGGARLLRHLPLICPWRAARAAARAPAAGAAAALLGWPRALAAHPGRAPEPHDLWTAWTVEPAELVLLALAAFLYGRGVRALWRRAGSGAGVRGAHVACLAAGWIALAVALVSPLHALGGALFSAHMAQHELLMAVAAPLLVLGRPLVPTLWAVPMGWRRSAGRVARWRAGRRAWRALAAPGSAALLHGAALWAWHAPALYATALRSDLAHGAQHASFLGTGLLFWWAVLAPLQARDPRRGAGASVLWLFVTMIHTGLLGALLAVSRRPWYPDYARTTLPWGLNALEDQQLAGLVMWVPAGVAYVGAALAVLAAALRGGAGTRVRRSALSAPAAPAVG